MRKAIAVLVLIVILCLLHTTASTEAKGIDKMIPISNIEVLQGVVSFVDDEYIHIDTIDGNGWVLEVSEEAAEAVVIINDELVLGDNIVVVFDNMGTDDIYDDEIIGIVIVAKTDKFYSKGE